MGLISGMVMGVVVGVAIMAGWSRFMLRRSRKRIAKVGSAARRGMPPALSLPRSLATLELDLARSRAWFSRVLSLATRVF